MSEKQKKIIKNNKKKNIDVSYKAEGNGFNISFDTKLLSNKKNCVKDNIKIKSEFIVRIENEIKELSVKVNKLSEFMVTDKYFNLTEIEQKLLGDQFRVMCEYKIALKIRLSFYTNFKEIEDK